MSEEKSYAPACVLYVCCGSKCKKRESKHIYKQLNSSVKEKSIRSKIQVIKTGCTDNCRKGPVIALMPENVWYFKVTDEKARLILENAIHRL